MAASKFQIGAVLVFSLIFSLTLQTVHGQALAPAPAPTSDGTKIDQGIAYMLMALALVLTYIIHSLDAPFGF